MTSCSDDVIRIRNAKTEINRDEGNYERRRLDETTKMSTKVKTTFVYVKCNHFKKDRSVLTIQISYISDIDSNDVSNK